MEKKKQITAEKAQEISTELIRKRTELLDKMKDSNRKLDELRERTQEFLHPEGHSGQKKDSGK